MAIEGYTIYFRIGDAPRKDKAYLLTGRFVQFYGKEKPSIKEINNAFKEKYPAFADDIDLSTYPSSCFSWRYDADPRVEVEFAFEIAKDDGRGAWIEDWEWDNDVLFATIKESSYLALLQGGEAAIRGYIEGKAPYGHIIRKCRMRKC